MEIFDVVELVLMVFVSGIGLLALRRMDNLLDEIQLLRESLNSRLPPK
jgi:hypothetical protein